MLENTHTSPNIQPRKRCARKDGQNGDRSRLPVPLRFPVGPAPAGRRNTGRKTCSAGGSDSFDLRGWYPTLLAVGEADQELLVSAIKNFNGESFVHNEALNA